MCDWSDYPVTKNKFMIEIILFIALCFLFIFEFATFIVYGGFVSKQITDEFMNLDQSKLSINQYNSTILMDWSKYPVRGISTLPFSIFSKYYISDVGTIPRWSKLHKQIKLYYEVAKQNSLKQ